MTDFDITTTAAYQDALKAEAKKARKKVDMLGAKTKLRAETAAYKALDAVGTAAENVIADQKEELAIGGLFHYYQPFSASTGMVNEAPAPINDEVVDLTEQMMLGLVRGKIPAPKGSRKAASTKPTKKSLAIQAYAQNLGARRKDVIMAMVNNADLSEKGAATYYQNIKSGKKGWEV